MGDTVYLLLQGREGEVGIRGRMSCIDRWSSGKVTGSGDTAVALSAADCFHSKVHHSSTHTTEHSGAAYTACCLTVSEYGYLLVNDYRKCSVLRRILQSQHEEIHSAVHPFPFYQNSPTPFPGRRS